MVNQVRWPIDFLPCIMWFSLHLVWDVMQGRHYNLTQLGGEHCLVLAAHHALAHETTVKRIKAA